MMSPTFIRSSHSAAALLASVLLIAATGCQKDEAPPPLPQAKPAETPQVATLVPEGEDDFEEEEEQAAPKTGTRKAAPGPLAKCCQALRQNAANAPPETAGHMLTAAAACDAANSSGKTSAASVISSLLKGAQMPAVCQ